MHPIDVGRRGQGEYATSFGPNTSGFGHGREFGRGGETAELRASGPALVVHSAAAFVAARYQRGPGETVRRVAVPATVLERATLLETGGVGRKATLHGNRARAEE